MIQLCVGLLLLAAAQLAVQPAISGPQAAGENRLLLGLEQPRLGAGVLQSQLSKPTLKKRWLSHLTLQNLSRVEQPILELQPVSLEGRQFGRQIVLKSGGDPAADPPNWPQPGDLVRLVFGASAFEDSFGNTWAEYSFAELLWPGQDGILVDSTPPRLEEICAFGSTLKLTFSEPVSDVLAGAALEIDGQPANWQSENGGYTLSLALPVGDHSIGINTTPLGTGSGVAATVQGGTSIGMGLGGAAASASSGGSYESFARGAFKGGILGALGSVAGLGLEAVGLSSGWMFGGSFAADTIAGTGIDLAFGDCRF